MSQSINVARAERQPVSRQIKGDTSLPEKLFVVLIYSFVALFALIALLPFWLVDIGSFTPETILRTKGFQLFPNGFSTYAYQFVLNGRQIFHSYRVTLTVTVLGTTLALLVTTPFAYVLASRKAKLAPVLSFMTYFTMIFGGEMEVVNFFDKSKKRTITFHQWNFISLADVSKNKERALMFLDWAHQQENYDLLAYGIKGKNWEDAGPGLYKPLAASYRWFPYGWIWNPTLDRENALAPKDGLAWNQWAKDANNFTADMYVGFNLDLTPLTNQVSQTGGMKSEFWKPLMYGAVDPDKTWADYQTKSAALYDQIQAEFEKQAANFRAKKG